MYLIDFIKTIKPIYLVVVSTALRLPTVQYIFSTLCTEGQPT
jgi:hypothetical protein